MEKVKQTQHQLLNQKAQRIAQNYKNCERELVAVIAQVDAQKFFYILGHNSLFSYMTDALGLSPAVASNISAVVRKSQTVPQLQDKVLNGEISLSKARKIAPVIDKSNCTQWLALAKEKTQRQLEREVALASPDSVLYETSKYVASHLEVKEKVTHKRSIPRLQLQMGLSESLMLKLRRCQDLESQRLKKNINLENCLESLVENFLERHDPVRKAQRQKSKGKLSIAHVKNKRTQKSSLANNRHSESNNANASVSDRSKKRGQSQIKANRQPIPAAIAHQVQLRDQGRCTYVDSKGKRCQAMRFLEIHHKIPVSRGGKNELSNLQLLCSGHHRCQHS